MPHVVLRLGALSATTEGGDRALIPGIEPGGSRAGQATKPALLIRDAWIEVINFAPAAAAGVEAVTVFLKLSQEVGLDPGLLLPVGQIGVTQLDATGAATWNVIDYFHAQGTIWAARLVGVQQVELGTSAWEIDVHLDYEQVDVPWMDWFIMWDFLDGISNDEREY